MKVIVNADDLGMSHQANEAIFSMIGYCRDVSFVSLDFFRSHILLCGFSFD